METRPPTLSVSPRSGLADHVPLLDVNRENQLLAGAIGQAIQRVCDSGRFILGPECQQLEQVLAERFGIRHVLGCASGSDALLLALHALEIQPGDEVIVPSFTFFATASAVWRLGAVPVFADIDPETFNLDPQSVSQRITQRTRAIIAVHLFGQPADMTALGQIARDRGLKIVEDAAQAIGARWQGQWVGGLGDVGCFSFYPTKNLGGFGDGGLLTTNDDQLADRLRLLRVHGMRQRYHHEVVGINSRLDTLQAAVLLAKLEHLESWTRQRRENAGRYERLLGAQAASAGWITLPAARPEVQHVWNQYTIRVHGDRRDALREHLRQKGVGTEIYYPVPLHQQPCFASLADRPPHLPATERAAREVLSLPVFPTMTHLEQDTVVAHLERFFLEAPGAMPGGPQRRSA